MFYLWFDFVLLNCTWFGIDERIACFYSQRNCGLDWKCHQNVGINFIGLGIEIFPFFMPIFDLSFVEDETALGGEKISKSNFYDQFELAIFLFSWEIHLDWNILNIHLPIYFNIDWSTSTHFVLYVNIDTSTLKFIDQLENWPTNFGDGIYQSILSLNNQRGININWST